MHLKTLEVITEIGNRLELKPILIRYKTNKN